MTLEQAASETRSVRTIPTVELKAQLEAYRTAKCWCGRYFELDTEVQRRATTQWVHEDVFGHTFGPLVDLADKA